MSDTLCEPPEAPQTICETRFQFEGQLDFYKGKVRDVYFFDDKVAIVATDRISAFDVVFPYTIPDKGRVLNQLAAHQLQATKNTVPNWLIATPDPNVALGLRCSVFPVEIVVRGYLAGHAWREYNAGKRILCGISLPDGLRENDPLPEPIITPTIKASKGKDEDITRRQIIERKLVNSADYACLEDYALKLYERGTQIAADRGLILVDTKYEFGKHRGSIYLVDELHTPDSSRYFYRSEYESHQASGMPQKHMSKEFVRQWSISQGFQGKKGQTIPAMDSENIASISSRYRELYRQMTGQHLGAVAQTPILERIEKNIVRCLSQI